MRVLILGATGRTGLLLTASALAKGHTVTALVRDPSALTPHASLQTIRGTPLSPEDVESAFARSPADDPIRAVFVTLAVPRASDSPFSPPTAAPFLIRDSVRNALAAMGRHGVRRIAVMSLAGCGDSWGEFPWVFRALFRCTQMAWVMRDHDAVDAEVRMGGEGDGSLAWTMVRATVLKEGDARPVRELGERGKGLGLFDGVTRASVADFMVGLLGDDRLDRKAVVIAN